MKTDNRNLGIVLLVCAVVAFAFQGSRGIYDTTEGRYAEGAREMIETGNWMQPQLGYEPHWTKPPLFYWAEGLSMKILGQNEWGLRIPNAIMALILCGAVYGIAASMWDPKTGLIAAAIFGTSPYVVAGTNTLSTDMMLAGWAGLSVLCYWRGIKSDGGRRRLWTAAMWGATGLGFLTKGPPMLLVTAVIIIHNIVMRRRGAGIKLFTIEGLGIFAVSGLGWYIASVVTNKGLISYWLKDEVVNRVASDKFGRHGEWYAVFTLYMPIVLFGAGVWMVAWKDIFAKYKKQMTCLGELRRFVAGDDAVLFLAMWLFLPLTIFCVSKSRMPLYLLPIFAPVAIVLARGMVRAQEELNWKGFWRAFLVTAVVCVAGKAMCAELNSTRDARAAADCFLKPAGDIESIMLNNHKDFGIQFYFGGRLLRVSSEPNMPMHDGLLADKINEINSAPRHELYQIIAKGLGSDDLRDKLEELGIGYKKEVIGHYCGYIIHSTKTRKTAGEVK